MLASARTHAATPTLTAFPGKSVDQHSRRLRRLISCSAVSQPSGMLLLTSKLSLLQITPVPAAPSAATSQSVVCYTLDYCLHCPACVSHTQMSKLLTSHGHTGAKHPAQQPSRRSEGTSVSAVHWCHLDRCSLDRLLSQR